jgi:hypothetical protein
MSYVFEGQEKTRNGTLKVTRVNIVHCCWPRDTYLGPRAVALRLPLDDRGANRLLERGHVAVRKDLRALLSASRMTGQRMGETGIFFLDQ